MSVVVLPPPSMPSSALFHRRRNINSSPSPSHTPTATASPRAGVITLSKPLSAFAHNHRNSHKQAASLPSTPPPRSDREREARKPPRQLHARARSSAATPKPVDAVADCVSGTTTSATTNSVPTPVPTPVLRPSSPSVSPSRRPALPHLPSAPSSPVKHRSGPHKRSRSSAPRARAQPTTTSDDDPFGYPTLEEAASKALAATAQGPPAAAAPRPSTPPAVHFPSAPNTPSAPTTTRRRAPNRNSVLPVPAYNLFPTPPSAPKLPPRGGSMRIVRPMSQPLDDGGLSRSVPSAAALSLPATDPVPRRGHKHALSLALPNPVLHAPPVPSSLPTTPLVPRTVQVPAHLRTPSFAAQGLLALPLSEEEASDGSGSPDDSSDATPSEDEAAFFGSAADLDEHARAGRNKSKAKQAGKDKHHEHRPGVTKKKGKIVYAGPTFYNSPAPANLPPPSFNF